MQLLAHENIVSLLGCTKLRDNLCLVMEICIPDLKKLCYCETRRLTEDEAGFFGETGTGSHNVYAHERGHSQVMEWIIGIISIVMTLSNLMYTNAVQYQYCPTSTFNILCTHLGHL